MSAETEPFKPGINPTNGGINPTNGLRKGFPIKIGGYSVGGESKDSDHEEICDNKMMRFRMRNGSFNDGLIK